MENDVIVLYPGNWLYNAGVIGFLEVMAYGEDSKEVEKWFKDDGSLEIKICKKEEEIFEIWDKLTFERLKYSYKNKNGNTQYYYYANQTENSIKKKISNLITGSSYTKSSKGKERHCSFCYRTIRITRDKISPLNQAYSKLLLGGVKNFYWNNLEENYVCDKCQFILMCHHIGFIPINNLSLYDSPNKLEIFVNTPSFKLMWYLNRYVKKVFGREKINLVRDLLGMSIMELALKFHIQLGKWTMMNIEVVSKNKIVWNEGRKKIEKDEINFFVVPYETVLLLSDRNIASLINDIGEINILNLVLDGKYREILDFGERVLRLALANSEKNKDSTLSSFIDRNIFLRKNKDRSENLISFSQKLFKLYALIEEKIGKGVHV